MTRRILVVGLALAPLVAILRWAVEPGDVPLFCVSALALVPLAWLIGEATEQAAEHTGAGIGGFVNATFGNAPELIIALFAIADGLPDVVRGSLTGSVVSNLLLVFGIALVVTDEEDLDRRSLVSNLGLVVCATLLFLIPSVPGWHGDPNRHSLAVASIPIAAVLLVLYFGRTRQNLRRHRRRQRETAPEPDARAWSLRSALVTLAIATGLTALVSEILVHTLQGFATSVGLSQFFVATVIVAVVGNASEHGGAIVVARRGKIRLASEIAVSSAAQVALVVAPVASLASFAVRPPLSLAFRPIELATIAGSALFVGVVVRDRRGTRREGAILLAAYAVCVVGFYVSGNR
jgi:Ca2+:H+ antiporter